jgi:transposase
MQLVGIDIAKHEHVAAVLDEQGQVVQAPFRVSNTQAGFEHLRQVVAGLPEAVLVGLEATGHYWLALYDALTRWGCVVVVFNPLQIHAFRKSGLRKVKNDRSDAVWIAEFMRLGHRTPTAPTLPALLQLKELTRFRFHLTELVGDCKRKVLSVLDRVFPEYESAFSSVFLASSRRLLAEAATPQEVADFDMSELSDLLHTASRGRFGAAQAEALQRLARQSVGVRFLADAARVELHCLLAQIELLEAQREQVDEAIAELLAQLPQYLTTIPGVGRVTAASLLAEIGDIQRFPSPEQLVAYAGIDASVYQTGQFEGTRAHMSKRGSPHLRVALWQAANTAILHNLELQAYYQRKRAEGKAHGTALGAVCRKLLIRIYVILKEQRPYRELPATAI